MSVRLFVRLCIWLPACCLSLCLSLCLCVCLSIYLSIRPTHCLSVWLCALPTLNGMVRKGTRGRTPIGRTVQKTLFVDWSAEIPNSEYIQHNLSCSQWLKYSIERPKCREIGVTWEFGEGAAPSAAGSSQVLSIFWIFFRKFLEFIYFFT